MNSLDLRGQIVSFKKVGWGIDTVESFPKIKKTHNTIDTRSALIDINVVIAKGNEFLKTLNIENSRYLSWEYCYTALASWGMYRGSSFLL